MSNFDSTKTQLKDLLHNICCGKIQLPDFQRGWVWNDEDIRSLLTSIARSFPVGAVMLLETGGEAAFKVRPVEGISPNEAPPEKVEKLILDGQQRLTSLTQVLMLQQPVETEDEKKRKIKRYYYINIEKAILGPEHYEDAIIGVDEDRTLRTNFGRDIVLDLRTQEKEFENFYFPCNKIFDPSEWDYKLAVHDSTKFHQYITQFKKPFLENFTDYHFPVIELKKENKKEAVCLVFEKVNTGGVKLSVFELITATYASEDLNLRDEWYGNRREGVVGISQRLSKQPLLRDIGTTEFFQGLSLLHTYERHKEDLAAGKTGNQATGVSAKREAVLTLPLSAYKKNQDSLEQGFWQAAKFLHKQSFFSRRDVPYRTQLVPLATVLSLLKDRWQEPLIYDKLSRWFWCGILGELYGGAVESRMANDLQQLMNWVDSDGAEEPASVKEANFQPGRLDTLRTRNSAAYKGIYVLLQRHGARDWFWKSTIRELDESEWEECKLDIHHIFPRKWCEDEKISPKDYNSILNKTPISYKANRMIGGKSPSEYLKQLQGYKTVQLDDPGMDELLSTHLLSPSLLRSDDFQGFIENRREQLIEKISRAMGKPVVSTGEAIADDEPDDDELSD